MTLGWGKVGRAAATMLQSTTSNPTNALTQTWNCAVGIEKSMDPLQQTMTMT